MSTKAAYLLISICIVAACTYLFLPNDEKKIKANLTSLADYCSTAKDESVMETLRKVTLATKLCTVPCMVEIQSRNFSAPLDQKEMSDHILMLKRRSPNTNFTFQDININIPTDDSADIITTIQINRESAKGQFTDAYEVDISATKIDGNWLFSSFTVVEFMKK